MIEKEYLLLIPQGNIKPLHGKFRDLDGFWNGIGYAFPMKSASQLNAIAVSLPGIKIYKLPLAEGQSFASYQQSLKSAFFKDKLIETDKKIILLKEKYKIFDEISEEGISLSLSIPESDKESLLELIREKERLKKSEDWALGMEKVLSAHGGSLFELKSIQELSPDYFKVKPLEKPVLLEFIKDGDMNAKRIPFLHKEIVAMLIAEGGRGKTHLGTLLGSCVAAAIPFLGKFNVVHPGAVCLIVGENNQDDIHRLLWKTREHLVKMISENRQNKAYDKFSTDGKEIERIETNLFPVSVHGKNAGLIDSDGKETEFFKSLLEQLIKKEPLEGWQLIILDPASRFAGPESEKDNAIATAFIACLEKISESLKGKPTILLSHHKSKAAINNSSGQSDARGASALTDGVRWQANLDKDKKENTITLFEITKTNFTPIHDAFKIKKDAYGVPFFDKWVPKAGENTIGGSLPVEKERKKPGYNRYTAQ